MIALLAASLVMLAGSRVAPAGTGGRSIAVPPAALKLAAFYRRYIDAQGIPIVSSSMTGGARVSGCVPSPPRSTL